MNNAVKKTELVEKHINFLLSQNVFDGYNPPTAKDIAQEMNIDRGTVAKGLEPFIKRNILKNVRRKGIVRVRDNSLLMENAAVLVLRSRGDIFSELTGNLVSGLNRRGITTLIIDSQTLKEGDQGSINNLQNLLLQQPRILISDLSDIRRKETSFLNGIPMPDNCIFLFSYSLPGEIPGSGIFVDRESGAYRATRHILEKGHRKIALCIHAKPGDIIDSVQMRRTPYYQFITGCNTALKEYDLPEAKLLVWSRDDNYDTVIDLENIMSGPDCPTAFVCLTDYYAVTLMMHLLKIGLKVPEDISLIGFGNTPWCELAATALTSMDLNIEKMVELAVNEALSENPSRTIHQIQPELVVRDSVHSIV